MKLEIPQKKQTKPITLNMPVALVRLLDVAARKRGCTRTDLIVAACNAAVGQEKK